MSYTTPAWDLTLVGYQGTDIRYNVLGEAFLLTGEHCIRLAITGRFITTDFEHCMAPTLEADDLVRPAFGISPDMVGVFLGNPATNHLMFLETGACT